MPETRPHDDPSPSKLWKVALGVSITLLVAAGIAGALYVLVPRSTEPSYTINPAAVSLTTLDVGAAFHLVVQIPIGPSQQTAPGHSLPYQRQLVGGSLRYFMVKASLVPPGATEIATYEQAHGFTPTNPPTIFGPFVADHQGLFEVMDAEESYHVASAAHADFQVGSPYGPEAANLEANYANWQTFPIHLGNEAWAWGGIRDSPTNPPQSYEEQAFLINWRTGPVASEIFIRGAHNLTLQAAMHLAGMVNAHVTSAIQHSAIEASLASSIPRLAASNSGGLAVVDCDNRLHILRQVKAAVSRSRLIDAVLRDKDARTQPTVPL